MLSVVKHLCVYSRAQSARDSSEIESLASRALPAALQLRFAQNDITRSTTINAFIGEVISKSRRLQGVCVRRRFEPTGVPQKRPTIVASPARSNWTLVRVMIVRGRPYRERGHSAAKSREARN